MFTGGTCFGVEFKQKNHRSTEPEKIFLSFQDRKIEKREPNSIIRTAALTILSMRIRLEGVEKKIVWFATVKKLVQRWISLGH